MPDPNLPPNAFDVPLITASNFLVGFNVAEVHISLAYTALDRRTETLENRVSYSVTTAPQAALRLRDALNKALDDYERMFGPIPRDGIGVTDQNGRSAESGNVRSLFGAGPAPRDPHAAPVQFGEDLPENRDEGDDYCPLCIRPATECDCVCAGP